MTAAANPASRPPRHGVAAGAAEPGCTTRVADRVDAGGTMWRLRSLVAMGHDAARLGRVLDISPRAARRVISGDVTTVSRALRDLACELWNAWWDKRPPEDTPARRRAATTARHIARRHNWCQPLGLDEDYLDTPGYRPYSTWRPATGTRVARDFRPADPEASKGVA